MQSSDNLDVILHPKEIKLCSLVILGLAFFEPKIVFISQEIQI